MVTPAIEPHVIGGLKCHSGTTQNAVSRSTVNNNPVDVLAHGDVRIPAGITTWIIGQNGCCIVPAPNVSI